MAAVKHLKQVKDKNNCTTLACSFVQCPPFHASIIWNSFEAIQARSLKESSEWLQCHSEPCQHSHILACMHHKHTDI